MNLKAAPLRRCVLVSLAIGASWPAGAEVVSGSCGLPTGQGGPLMELERELARYHQLPDGCLKTMFMQCSAASEKEVLGMGTVMECSLGYEALLKRVFAGNFDALLAWWRDERGAPAQEE